MRSFIGAVGGNVDVDFMDENYNTAHSASYEGVSPARVLSGITNFYDEGIKPKGNVSYSVDRLNKRTVEKGFGGIWIADKQEFAKFASAVRTTPHEEDGEGIAFTDNYFYAYYRNIDGQPIPFASVYMNRYESQDVVNEVNEVIANVRKGERAKFYFDRAVVRFRNIQNKDNANDGDNQSASHSVRASGVVRRLLRKGGYYANPHLYVKTQRTDIKDYDEIDNTNYSLNRTDIEDLDAVNRGDIETESYSLNRDDVTIATPEMEAEANFSTLSASTLFLSPSPLIAGYRFRYLCLSSGTPSHLLHRHTILLGIIFNTRDRCATLCLRGFPPSAAGYCFRYPWL